MKKKKYRDHACHFEGGGGVQLETLKIDLKEGEGHSVPQLTRSIKSTTDLITFVPGVCCIKCLNPSNHLLCV